MRQKTKSAVTVAVAVVTAIGMFFAGFFTGRIKDPDSAALDFIYKTYKKYYLETSDDAVKIMAESILDEYSEYYTREEYEEMKKISSGVRGGVGMSFYDNADGNVEIYSVLGNSPAERSGVKRGGLVKAIKRASDADFVAIKNRTALGDAIAALALKEEFALRIEYDGAASDYVLAREEYRESYVYYADASGTYRYSGKGDDLKLVKYEDSELSTYTATFPADTAYLRYTAFSGTAKGVAGSKGQIDGALKKFAEDKKTKLVLDLRGNGGGFMSVCSDVAAYFVNAAAKSEPIIATAEYKKDKNGKGKVDIFEASPILYNNYGFESVVALADENTASASEVLLGAMLSYDKDAKVKIVLAESKEKGSDGTMRSVYRTYGKGIMQTTYPSAFGGGALKLTTAKLYWPDELKSCIHGVGIRKTSVPYGDRIETPEVIDGKDYVLLRALELCA